MRFNAIFYDPTTLTPRGGVGSDDGAAFLSECANAVRENGWKVISSEDPAVQIKPPWDLDTLKRLIAAHEKVPVEAVQLPAAVVVDPETREVVDSIIAHPAVDSLEGAELHVIEGAKFGDKITEEGERLARVVTGDRDGKVEAVEWIAPDKIPEGYVEDSTAQPGETVDALKLTDAPSEGTVKL